MTDPAPDPFDTLETLLMQERDSLLSGALDNIAPLMAEKTVLISQLRRDLPEDAERVQRLHATMLRNQALFDQTLAGLRNAAERVGNMQQLRRSMEIYDATGRRATIDMPPAQRVERRA